MTEDENEPYNSIDSVLHALVWPVVILVAIVDVAVVVAFIWSLR